MPIRMVDDENQDNGPDNNPGNGGGGGGGGFGGGGGGLIGLLLNFLPLLIRYPKLLIVLVLAGGIYYFVGQGGHGVLPSRAASSQLTLGGVLDQKQFDKAEVYEALADNVKNPLPDRVTLEQYAPQRQNQGAQGSCVAWSSAYAARTILRARQTGEDPNKIAFSPAFLYNQIKLSDDCQGSYIQRAMETMTTEGILPLSEFPYTDQSCSKMPAPEQKQEAGQYKIKGANRLTQSGDNYKIDMLAIKQNLAQGAPVVIGMMVGGSFMQGMMGKKVWIPTREDYDMAGFGGHAICVMGYDDNLQGGAFELMNSWGSEWGDNGLAWVRYKDFEFFVKEAYGTYPMGDANTPKTTALDVQVGLVSNATKGNIALHQQHDNVFATATPLHIGDKFKMEVTNTIECYTYVLGQDTDGSSYVLFPYTAKHSPYCGITGTRLFPKDKSMQADRIGTKDMIAIVVTKNPIDYKDLNAKVNAAKGSFAEKVNASVADIAIPAVEFKAAEKVSFHCEPGQKNAVAVIVEIDKK